MSTGTILVSGMVAGVPGQGGASWAVLQYLLGLRRLGHEVVLVEPVTVAPGVALERSPAATYGAEVMRSFGLDGSWALLPTGSTETVGLAYEDLRAAARRADILLNVSGMLTDGALLEPVPVRAYLDLDPAFNQLWHEVERIDMRFDGHTHFATVGLSLGRPECPIPTCGYDWIHTCQPTALDHWPVANRVVYDGLTTVANWRGYGSIHHDGTHYGQKAHSLRPLMDLPTRSNEPFI
ncbi:MAG: hypothetical protein M3179_15295, partial [Actinomycetota bacterium]|nr:hypothetical protein [Actinomycetota bacterium]